MVYVVFSFLFFPLPLLMESVVPFDVLTAVINGWPVSLRVVGIPFVVLVADEVSDVAAWPLF